MAAATITGSEAKSTAQARAGVGETILYGEFSLADDNASGALELNDVMEVVKVPRGFQVMDVILTSTDLDTNGAPTISLGVGDGSDASRFISASTIGRTGGVERLNAFAGHGYIYTAADTIDVKVTAAVATGATTGTIKVTVIGRMV